MKGILIIHPYSKTCLRINFDVLIEKTIWNRLRFRQIADLIEKLSTGYLGTCKYVETFLEGTKKKYWHLYCEDLDHVSPESNNQVIIDLDSLKLKVVVMEVLN